MGKIEIEQLKIIIRESLRKSFRDYREFGYIDVDENSIEVAINQLAIDIKEAVDAH